MQGDTKLRGLGGRRSLCGDFKGSAPPFHACTARMAVAESTPTVAGRRCRAASSTAALTAQTSALSMDCTPEGPPTKPHGRLLADQAHNTTHLCKRKVTSMAAAGEVCSKVPAPGTYAWSATGAGMPHHHAPPRNSHAASAWHSAAPSSTLPPASAAQSPWQGSAGAGALWWQYTEDTRVHIPHSCRSRRQVGPCD